MKRRYYIVVLMLLVVLISTIKGSVFVNAQSAGPIVSPSAIIDFEEEAVRIENGRGYFNTTRKAKVIIKDESDFFDEDSATNGIKIYVKNAKGDRVSFSEEEISISEWVHSGNIHSTEIEFRMDGNYTWEITYKNRAGKTLEKISTGKSVTPFVFTIDREAPYGEIKAVSNEGVEIKWGMLNETWKYELYSKEGIIVSGEFQDEVSGTPIKVFYYKESGSDVKNHDSLLKKEDLDAVLNWKDFSELELEKDQSSVIYFKIVDLAGNYTYINTGGLMVDSQKPVLEKFTAQADDSANDRNGIYNSDVTITIEAADPLIGNTFSGIQSVSYKVFNMGQETQSGIWDDFSENDIVMKKTQQTWKGQFTIDSQRNNSNDVMVVVSVQDYAGNIATKTMKLKIDISKPVIHVFYDNNNAQNKSYFSKERIGTIVIQERNFRPEDVEIQITNSENTMPNISEWTKTAGSDNLDNTQWMMKISYIDEGDYTFHISYRDLAGNECGQIDYGTSISPTKFTIDKTLPMVTVQYDNNSAKNENYYNAVRTATINIVEHNLDSKDIEIYSVVKENGESIPFAEIQEWIQEGDKYTTQISYIEDGEYIFDISVTDKAGNKCEEYKEEVFILDMTFPLVEIEGVEHDWAYQGTVCPRIRCIDDNYKKEQISATLTKCKEEEASLGFITEPEEKGMYYVYEYENVPIEKKMDGVYELIVTMTDKAGNCTEKNVKFSINRFGSSYTLGEDTRKINYTYIQNPIDLILKEKNVDVLNDIKIIMFKNEEPILLKEGVDYDIVLDSEADGTYQYKYTIFAENFRDDGVYHIHVQSEDKAGNFSNNTTSGEDSSIRFGVDTIEPNLMIRNLEDGKLYESETWTVYMSAKDNFVLNSVVVYLDGEVYKTWNAEELKDREANNQELTFDIIGDSMRAHKIEIVCSDEAGNELLREISGVYVTTNKWVRLWKNKWLLCGIAFGMVCILIILRIVRKKRSNSLSILEK